MATTAVWSLNEKPWPPGSFLDPTADSRSSDGSTSSSIVDSSVRNSIRTISSSSGSSGSSSARNSMVDVDFSTSSSKDVKIRRTNSCTTRLEDAIHGVRTTDSSSLSSITPAVKLGGSYYTRRNSRSSTHHRSSLALIFPQAIEEEDSVARSSSNGDDLNRADRSSYESGKEQGDLSTADGVTTTLSAAPDESSNERDEDCSQQSAGQESFLLQESDRAAPSNAQRHAGGDNVDGNATAAAATTSQTQAGPIIGGPAATIGSKEINPISGINNGDVTFSTPGRNRVWDKLCNFIRPYYYQTATVTPINGAATSTSAPLLATPSSSDSQLGSAILATSSDDDRASLRAAAHHTRSSSYNSRLFCFGVLPATLAIPYAPPAPPAQPAPVAPARSTNTRTLLPPLPSHLVLSDGRGARKTLVLDLDETLVHSSFAAPPAVDFIVPLTMDGRTASVYVLKRPGVEQFLAAMAPIFEIVVFTASLSRYADPVLDLLDPSGRFVHHRLFREACVQLEGGAGYVKDLSFLGRDLRDVILVDNAPLSYSRQPANGVPIASFIDDPRDVELLALIPFLEHMARVGDDVRRHLGGGGAWTKESVRESAAGGGVVGGKQQESGCKQAMC